MFNKEKIEGHFKVIHDLIENLSISEKELLSDKLLAYLLFQQVKVKPEAKAIKKMVRKKAAPISKKDQELIKRIADKTDELYKRFGGDTI